MRSLTDTARTSSRCADLPMSTFGDSWNARKRSAARVTAFGRGWWAATSSPPSIPAMEACRPDCSVASHSPRPARRYGAARQTPYRLSSPTTVAKTATSTRPTASRESL